ncbi:unnamed protein product [Parnassius apollo]|uniref:(apollo) hypothetical protein n=1 Tax=Parnassius apollo TaxID=110799 RepID=A0A8S3WJY2_PARAO|nr:unnamed protein product [Parnassius apollo]
MDSSDEEMFLFQILFDEENRIKKKQRSVKYWVHDINRKRNIHGEFCHLFSDLQKDPSKFFQYFRMTFEKYQELLNILDLKKQNTRFRKPIPSEERLALCLRFLATGNSFRSLAFSFRMGERTPKKKNKRNSAGDLTPELEEKLYQHILEMEACLYGLTPKDDYEFVILLEDNDNLPAIENENMIVDPLFSELNDVDDNGIPKDVTSDVPPFSCTSVESTDVNTMQTIPSASKTPVILSPDLSDNCNNINIQPETSIIATKEVKQ